MTTMPAEMRQLLEQHPHSSIPRDLRNAGEESLPSLEPIPAALIWKPALKQKIPASPVSKHCSATWRALSWHTEAPHLANDVLVQHSADGHPHP